MSRDSLETSDHVPSLLIVIYSLSHDAARGRVWFVAQSAKMSAGNYCTALAVKP